MAVILDANGQPIMGRTCPCIIQCQGVRALARLCEACRSQGPRMSSRTSGELACPGNGQLAAVDTVAGTATSTCAATVWWALASLGKGSTAVGPGGIKGGHAGAQR